MHKLIPLAILMAVAAQAQVKWDFEDPKLTWRPRADTVKVELVPGGREPGKACLHISGAEPANFNYAISDQHPMAAGQPYRLSVWLKVDALPEGTAAPAVKCEFVPGEGGTPGRVVTLAYTRKQLGQWQQLVTEFEAPVGTVSFWLALEKNGNSAMTIDCLLDDAVVEPIKELTVMKQYDLDPLPAPLQRLKGVHPRLYLTAEQLEGLRQASQTTHAAQWQKIQALADRFAQNGPPAYIERDKSSGDEQLWQREVGNAMPTLALAYVVTQDSKYLDGARAWALASCSYPTWGLGSIDGMDLATGHQLFGLGIVYDWCYEGLGEEARKTIRETFVRRAGNMYSRAAAGSAWWNKSYLQNHLWVNAAGLASAGLAVYDEVPEAVRWVGLPLAKFTTTMEALGPDGASHEGVGYWQYGVEYMLKFMVLARDLIDKDLFRGNEWWRNTAFYALYFQLPRQSWEGRNNIVDIADCPRGNWYGPEYLLWLLASEYGNGYAQWQANEEFAAGITAPGAPWLNLLWYDAKVAAKAPADLPTLRHFEDMGLVSARSDWSGRESMVLFKCGPFIGHEAVKEFDYDPGGGHVHPDANHFLVFGDGEWLIRDDGYAEKWTGQHNTLLVDGKGQTGEGHWFNGSLMLNGKTQPTITQAASQPEMDHIIGDATAAYLETLGLRKYRRHLLFLKPDLLLVLDDIEADKPRALELRFHPEQQQSEQDGSAYVMRGKNAVLRVEPLTLEGAEATGGIVGGTDRNGQEMPLQTIQIKATAQRWRNATAFSWAAAGAQPVAVKFEAKGDTWVFRAGDRTVLFVWPTETLTLQ